jgi:anti-sigma factor RsiW
MTPCQRKPDDIIDLMDGALESSKKKEAERHVEECCDCARLLRRVRLQKSILKRLTPIKTNDAFFVVLQERIRREIAGKRRRPERSLFETRWWMPAAAFATVVVVAGVWFLSGKTRSPVIISATSAPKTQATARVPRKEARRVQYVIDEFPRNRKPNPARSGSSQTQLASSDTALPVRNFDGLKGRLVPVSF